MESTLPADGIGIPGEEYSFTFIYDSNIAQTGSMQTHAQGGDVVFRWSSGDGYGGKKAGVIDSDGYAYMELKHAYAKDGPYAITVTVEAPEIGKNEPGKQLAELSHIVQIGEALEVESFILQCDGNATEEYKGERGVHHHVWDLSGIPTGATIDLWFNTIGQPDKYIVEYPVDIVAHDTGWRGSEFWYERKIYLYPGGLAGDEEDTVSGLITKSAEHDSMEMTIIGPDEGTRWYYTLTCNQ